MKHKIAITIAGVFFSLGTGELHAQENTTAAGGEATGSGGSSSYSIGQVVYTTNTSSNGSVAQGIQQPYEISIVTGVNETDVILELSVYPNPTTDYLQLEVENEKFEKLSFQLYNMQGKLVKGQKIIKKGTTINMESLPKSIYFLKVTDNKQIVKTFKIIKN